jgi:Transposase-associated domain
MFFDFAFGNLRVVCERNGKKCIRCPCAFCDNRKFFERGEVSKHLLRKGFRPLYYRWHKHGEPYSTNATTPSSILEEDVGENRME